MNSSPVPSFRILVAEDDPMVREVICAQLTELGHQPESAEDGLDGLSKFKNGSFDLVITDRAMPGLNGHQLARAVKEVNPDMPVMLLTGFGDAPGDAAAAGINIIVSKPFSFNTLRDSIARIMS